ncbi:MAG: hypothetical protein HC904_08865 [Blastochloris sp.]|nr:hypothetical protein [Blastochloris sp.]
MMQGLRWQGLLSSGPEDFQLQPQDEVLLWQNQKPLIFVKRSARSLMFNFDFEYSNADRLPAVLVMLNRFWEEASRALPGFRAVTARPGQLLALSSPQAGVERKLTFRAGPVEKESVTVLPSDTNWFHAPLQPGLFEVSEGDQLIMKGAVQLLDPFEGDLRKVQAGGDWKSGFELRRMSESSADPFRMLWFFLVLGLALLLWHLQRGRQHEL